MSRRPTYDRAQTVAMLRVSLTAGDALKQAAFNANVTYAYAAKVARETGLKFPRPKLFDETRAAEMADMFRAGRTLAQIGRQFKLSKQRVQQIISQRHGLRMHDGGSWQQVRERAAARPVFARSPLGTSVYFARCEGMEGPIKIGCTKNPGERVNTLSAWAPFPVEVIVAVPGDFKLAQRVHHHFADLHLHRAWFRADDRLLAAIERLKAGSPTHVAMNLLDDRGPIRPPSKRSAEWRLGMSYAHRLRWAIYRAQEHAPAGYYFVEPDDTQRIMRAWSRSGYALPLSEADRARVEQVIDDPEIHGILVKRTVFTFRAAHPDFMPSEAA